MRKLLCAVAVLACLVLCAVGGMAEGITLNLSNRTFENVEDIATLIDQGRDVTAVDLNGIELTYQERRALMERYPQVHFMWTLEVYGVSISSEDTEVDFEGVRIGKVSDLSDALDCLPKMQNVYMWTSSIKHKDRVALKEAHPDVFFGWAYKLNGYHNFRTDMTAFSTLGTHLLNKSYMVNFTFCPNLLALDVGHNLLKDISFLYDCNKLKILILADTGIKDITPLESQTELEYLELFLNDITDISVLSKLTKLRDLNISFNDITDLSPLYDLPNLERVWLMMNTHLTQEEIDRLREHQPDCEIVVRSWGATGNVMIKEEGDRQIPNSSWRHHPHYDTINYIFNTFNYVGWDEELPAEWRTKR